MTKEFNPEYIEHIIFSHLGISGSACSSLAKELFMQFEEQVNGPKSSVQDFSDKLKCDRENIIAWARREIKEYEKLLKTLEREK